MYTCEHGTRQNRCVPCGGSQICEHKKLKDRCRECKGVSICPHNKRKDSCMDCGSSAYCEHNIQRVFCIPCHGTSICEHNKRKYQCHECKGTSFCSHGVRKASCIECKGSGICKHNILKYKCHDCKGKGICVHDKDKRRCKICDGRDLCKSEWCEVRGITKYNDYCLQCCIQLCPDITVSQNYKTKEKEVTDHVLKTFPNFTWVVDKKVKDGCSKRRPDLLLDMGSHIIIVEIDEHRHIDYDSSCEHKRLMEISQDVGHRSIIFIRFNPDSYRIGNKLITSCWTVNKTGTVTIKKKKEWKERLCSLNDQIQFWITNITEKTVEIVELFY